jgi:DNA methylase
MLTSVKDGRQLCLFEDRQAATQLDDWLWCQSFDRQESTLHALSAYPQRSSPGLMRSLIELYSQPGAIVLDPFAGSGTVPFEAATLDRIAWSSDASPYAMAITAGKLGAPRSERAALTQAGELLAAIDRHAPAVDLQAIPAWVQDFFHPATLQELVAAFQELRQHPNPFLAACMLGILHHVLPGFLSYPTSAEAPYLRRVTYAPDRFPHLYTYRDLRSRLLSKVKRSYRKHRLPDTWEQRQYRLWQTPCAALPIAAASVDAIISRPPQADSFESVRNHRLRLWFLGVSDWQAIDSQLIPSGRNYALQMSASLQAMAQVLKPDRPCVLVVSDVIQHSKTRGIASTLADLATQTQHWQVETLHDLLPKVPPSRSTCKAVKFDQILVLRKC